MAIIPMNFSDLTKESSENKLKFAKEFSEGSKALEEFLLYLWDNNINTFACCKGHEVGETHHDEMHKPYIFLDYKNFSNVDFSGLLLKLLKNGDVERISVGNDNLKGLDERKTLGIYLKDQKTLMSSVFKNFYDVIENSKQEEINKDNYRKELEEVSDEKRDFIINSLLIKELKTIDNLTLQPFKDIYDKFPDKPNVVEQTFFKSDNSEKIDYYVDFPNSRTLLDEKTDKAVNLTTSAYKRFENGKCFMLDEKLEPIEVSEQEMNEKGFWEKGLYDKFIYELFAKNQIVFRRLLFCDKTKLKAEELDDGE